MPALTQFYGLTPADIDTMSYREVSEYIVQMERARAEEERAYGKQAHRG